MSGRHADVPWSAWLRRTTRPGASVRVTTLAWILLVILVAGAVTATSKLSATPPSSQAATDRPGATVKYYVVPPGRKGKTQSLDDIAQRTLGDRGRAFEIYSITGSRLQPDGGRLTAADEVRPGWILWLPQDARGPEVRTGRIPRTPPPAAVGWSAEWNRAPGEAGVSAARTALLLALLLLVLGSAAFWLRKPTIRNALARAWSRRSTRRATWRGQAARAASELSVARPRPNGVRSPQPRRPREFASADPTWRGSARVVSRRSAQTRGSAARSADS